MSKYDFVLYRAQSEDFIERLRELGLVDITTTGWEPGEEERQLVLRIEGYAKALESAEQWLEREQNASIQGEAYASAEEAYDAYNRLLRETARLNTELGKLEKAADELRPWGEFNPKELQALVEGGVKIRLFFGPTSSFEATEVPEGYTFEALNEGGGNTYFAVIGQGGELSLDAQEVRLPAMDIREAEQLIAACRNEIETLERDYARIAASREMLTAGVARLKEQLGNSKITSTAVTEADGTLLILRGWAEAETSAKVDALLEEYPNVVYLKGDPTPEDDTPVKLTNGWYSRIFEMVGDMYARPKYGTIDLTPFFAPFYMLFFGICLNDAGYGLILLLLALAILKKNPEPGMMRRAGWFATMCSLSTILFGGFCGSFFGLSLGEFFPSISFFDFQGQFFSIALAIGMVQIIFGLMINVWGQWRTFGFTSCFGTLGWLIVLLAGSLAVGLPMFGMEIPGFTASSPAFYAAVGLGFVLMLLLNNMRRNPLMNIGSGLWDLYNNITGLLSDVLSYIRLFAIGLSGGVLALVFNSLAEGFVPEGANIVVRILIMLPILLIGHGINLFMSAISSFVHPMRLTFVEFYKNAGFEMASRNFEPLKKENQTNK
ncbi:MAG: V-type ATP synthase subunit I [Rikenellaceae bacterium]|nr:V-type ATP synthase subunit I [Rikenellaceae bacterium]